MLKVILPRRYESYYPFNHNTAIENFFSRMDFTNRITQLSAIIAKNTAIIDDYLMSNDQPTPSLGPEALWSLPIPDDAVDIKAARLAVMEACSELKALVTGPKELLRFSASIRIPTQLRIGLLTAYCSTQNTCPSR
jgi:hypothetical protein